MATSVVMPALEMAQETGKLIAWRKKEGEQVKKGEPLLEVETDKAVVEVEALGDGILAGVTADVGAVVPVGQTIAWLVQPGEAPPAATAPAQTGRRTDVPSGQQVAAPAASTVMGEATGAVRISPKARRLAKEHFVDIARVRGTGPDGEIVAEDVLAVAKGGPMAPAPVTSTTAAGSATPSTPATPATMTASSPPAASRPSPVPAASSRAESPSAATSQPPSTEIGAMSSIGRLMAERTTQSWTTVPHFFVTREVDGSALVAAREELGREIERMRGVKLTYTDLLAAIVARVLRQHPRMNASWAGESVRPNPDVNVGLAMAVSDAVVVAVIPKTDATPLADIALRRRELTDRARASKLQPADIGGATFTISNLGMYHVDAFTAIIVPPQAGILAIGAMTDRVVPVPGGIGVKPMLSITLSCDHRVVDGARGAAFLHDVVVALGEPKQHLR